MTDHTMDHEALHESVGLYVLNALEPEERAEFERHLATCAECTEEVRSLRIVADALPFSVPQVEPPAALGARILAAAGAPATAPHTAHLLQMPVKTTSRGAWATAGWLSAAAMFVLSAGLSVYAWSLQQQVGGLQDRLADAVARLDRSEEQVAVVTRTASTAQGRLTVLLAPDMLQVSLAGQPVAPTASGKAFWSRSRGLVFTAANLPPLPAGRTYQLWMVPNGAPISAGLVTPDASGAISSTFETASTVPEPVAIALTIEPEGGLPAPSGDKYLVGLTH